MYILLEIPIHMPCYNSYFAHILCRDSEEKVLAVEQ